MLYTLAQARTQLSKYVDEGTCNNAVADQRINEALERLTDGQDYECMVKSVRISACNHCFPLPFNVEKIMDVAVNGTPSRVYGTAYQFASSGPGDLDYGGGGSCFHDLVDKGDDWPVMFDVPTDYTLDDGTEYVCPGLNLVAFSTSATDVGTTIRVQGYDINSREIAPGIDPGVDVEILQWDGGTIGTILGTWETDTEPGWAYTTELFADVARVVKPVTAGAIHLYALDTVNQRFFLLAEYHASQTIPQFRRYSLTNKCPGYRSHVLARVKMRHVPLSQPTDILPVDSLEAVKLMLMALRQENAGDLGTARAYADDAARVMDKRERSRTMAKGTPQILNTGFRTSLGRHMNRRRRIL
jgi:hypothetical protein